MRFAVLLYYKERLVLLL